jgi:hypothetical protein
VADSKDGDGGGGGGDDWVKQCHEQMVLAAKHGSIGAAAVRALLHCGAPADPPRGSGSGGGKRGRLDRRPAMTPLHAAARWGNVPVVEVQATLSFFLRSAVSFVWC